jgi:hypothetical protein
MGWSVVVKRRVLGSTNAACAVTLRDSSMSHQMATQRAPSQNRWPEGVDLILSIA